MLTRSLITQKQHKKDALSFFLEKMLDYFLVGKCDVMCRTWWRTEQEAKEDGRAKPLQRAHKNDEENRKQSFTKAPEWRKQLDLARFRSSIIRILTYPVYVCYPSYTYVSVLRIISLCWRNCAYVDGKTTHPSYGMYDRIICTPTWEKTKQNLSTLTSWFIWGYPTIS